MKKTNSISRTENQVLEALAKVEKEMGAKFGDKDNPLLVSVRSGARASMPGMMETVLNVGLNDETREGLLRKPEIPVSFMILSASHPDVL